MTSIIGLSGLGNSRKRKADVLDQFEDDEEDDAAELDKEFQELSEAEQSEHEDELIGDAESTATADTEDGEESKEGTEEQEEGEEEGEPVDVGEEKKKDKVKPKHKAKPKDKTKAKPKAASTTTSNKSTKDAQAQTKQAKQRSSHTGEPLAKKPRLEETKKESKKETKKETKKEIKKLASKKAGAGEEVEQQTGKKEQQGKKESVKKAAPQQIQKSMDLSSPSNMFSMMMMNPSMMQHMQLGTVMNLNSSDLALMDQRTEQHRMALLAQQLAAAQKRAKDTKKYTPSEASLHPLNARVMCRCDKLTQPLVLPATLYLPGYAKHLDLQLDYMDDITGSDMMPESIRSFLIPPSQSAGSTAFRAGAGASIGGRTAKAKVLEPKPAWFCRFRSVPFGVNESATFGPYKDREDMRLVFGSLKVADSVLNLPKVTAKGVSAKMSIAMGGAKLGPKKVGKAIPPFWVYYHEPHTGDFCVLPLKEFFMENGGPGFANSEHVTLDVRNRWATMANATHHRMGLGDQHAVWKIREVPTIFEPHDHPTEAIKRFETMRCQMQLDFQSKRKHQHAQAQAQTQAQTQTQPRAQKQAAQMQAQTQQAQKQTIVHNEQVSQEQEEGARGEHETSKTSGHATGAKTIGHAMGQGNNKSSLV